MPGIYLKQTGFTYSSCGPFTKNKAGIENITQTGNTNFIYKNELDIAYGKSKNLVKRTQSDKVLKDRASKITSDPKYDGYQRELGSIVYKFFNKKSALLNKSSGRGIANEPNYQFTNELHKPIIRSF